jgi:hypothetical protein
MQATTFSSFFSPPILFLAFLLCQLRSLTVFSVEFVETEVAKSAIQRSFLILSLLRLLSRLGRMSQPGPKQENLDYLKEALNSDVKAVNIRLREGEYQFSLAKAIASFELELSFPDVKDLTKKLFGEKKTEDLQFVSKIQTILKKMEKSGVIKILPKDKPWELQRYALSSFKFQDVEKNLVILATNSEIGKTRELIYTQPGPKPTTRLRPSHMTSLILLLVSVMAGSYAGIIWILTQPTIDLLVFGSAFCIAAVSSILLGIFVSRRK